MKRATASVLTALAVAGFWAARGLTRRPPPVLRELPDFRAAAVTTRGVSETSRAGLLGRPWIADFIFATCTGPCPTLTAEMSRLQAELPAEVRLVSFTVDPVNDTLQALKTYAEAAGAEPDRWLFLRAEPGALYKLVYEGFQLSLAENRRAEPGARFIHSTRLVLVDRRGAVRGYYAYDDEGALAALRRDARRILQEAL